MKRYEDIIDRIRGAKTLVHPAGVALEGIDGTEPVDFDTEFLAPLQSVSLNLMIEAVQRALVAA